MTFRFQHFITPLGTKEFAKVVRAEGIYVFDNLGRRLLDGSSGAVSVNIGHAHPKVLAAMRAQMDEYLFTHCMRWENEPNVRLAERIERMSAWGFDAVYFLSGGSEANEAALKFARQLAISRGEASRWKIVSRMPSYHGATTALLGIVGDPDYSRPFEPMFVKNPKVDAPLLYRRPEGETPDDVVDRCLRQLEETIVREDPSTVLAFMIEPVGGVSTGCLVAPDRYMTGIRQICDRYGILLIYDEIMSGAGRTGRFLAAQYWPDCRPDIVTLAKGVSGSYAPLGAVLTSSALMESVRRAGGFKHGHTYAANPMSCAASDAVLGVVEEEGLMERATELGAVLKGELEALQSPLVGDVRGIGLQIAVEIVADRESKAIFPAEAQASERIGMLCREHGLLLFSRRTAGGANGEWLMVCPPLTTTREQIAELVGGLKAGLADFQREIEPGRVAVGA